MIPQRPFRGAGSGLIGYAGFSEMSDEVRTIKIRATRNVLIVNIRNGTIT